jgi:hypothetical protein
MATPGMGEVSLLVTSIFSYFGAPLLSKNCNHMDGLEADHAAFDPPESIDGWSVIG